MGAPSDEYNIESSKIAGRVNNNLEVESLANIIYAVFIEMFGENTFSDINKFKQECNDIAKIIFSKL